MHGKRALYKSPMGLERALLTHASAMLRYACQKSPSVMQAHDKSAERGLRVRPVTRKRELLRCASVRYYALAYADMRVTIRYHELTHAIIRWHTRSELTADLKRMETALRLEEEERY